MCPRVIMDAVAPCNKPGGGQSLAIETIRRADIAGARGARPHLAELVIYRRSCVWGTQHRDLNIRARWTHRGPCRSSCWSGCCRIRRPTTLTGAMKKTDGSKEPSVSTGVYVPQVEAARLVLSRARPLGDPWPVDGGEPLRGVASVLPDGHQPLEDLAGSGARLVHDVPLKWMFGCLLGCE